ncbi:MAG: hypothetical protein EPN43_12495 [Jatrophihabitans sp.]|nr:MAG: hypothetical protein EPN43_12495 [Jatrophihabitans sp.]
MTQWGLDTIFNPGKRHMDEEKRRLQSTREEIGDSSGGRRIDLESGKVTIRRAGPGTPPDDEPPAGAVEDDDTEDRTEDGTGAPDALDIADDTDPNAD